MKTFVTQSFKLVSGDAGAQPTSFCGSNWHSLVADNDEDGDDSVDHDVKEVSISNPDGEVIAEVKRMFLKRHDSKRNLGVEAIKIVRVEVDEEEGVSVVKELEEWTK